MKYLLAIYENEKQWESLPQAESKQIIDEYRAFTDAIQKSGNYIAGEALQPTTAATSVRIRDGKRLTTDGPFAETREQLGGFYLVEAKDLDEAIAMAARMPSARWGTIEVRPILDLAQPVG